jgi:hypothetical protein
MARNTNRHSRDPTILIPQEAAMTTPRSLDQPGTEAQSLPRPRPLYEQNPMWTRLHLFYFLATATIFLGLHAYFVVAWDSLYAHYPWRGYAVGVEPPFFSSSPRSEVVAYAVLFATSLGLTLLPPGRNPKVGIAMWAGVMAASRAGPSVISSTPFRKKWRPAMRRCRTSAVVFGFLSFVVIAGASAAYAAPRAPQGIYAKIDISDYVAAKGLKQRGDDDALKRLYNSVLENPAVSGIALQVHWRFVQPDQPPAELNWDYIDDAFERAKAHPGKKIQLIVTAGFNSPKWMLDSGANCDFLFQGHTRPVHFHCDTIDFDYYFEKTDQDPSTQLRLPLPWSHLYITHWHAFLSKLARRYGSEDTLVSVSMAGPTAASAEMIMPNNFNTCPPNTKGSCKQRNGSYAEDMWNVLFSVRKNPYPTNSDAAFIDQWEKTIDFYQKTFGDITLVITPGAGFGLPSFNSGTDLMPNPKNVLYNPECSYSATGGWTYIKVPPYIATRSCDAVTTVLSYFMDTFGGYKGDLMASQTSGMEASNPLELGPVDRVTGDVGTPGVKFLSWYSGFPGAGPRGVAAGAQFDHEFSTPSEQNEQRQGCWIGEKHCSIDPVQAEYNVLKSFFYQTPGAAAFGGPTDIGGKSYPTPTFLQVFEQDIIYAQKPKNCAAVPITDPVTKVTFNASAQDLLNAAQAALLGQQVAFPPPHTGC